MTMDTTAAMSTEELDAQLVSTLREIDPYNYAYLFERCKRCNVKAGHLRFFKKDQIHELIPKSELGILAEFEYLLSLWQISKGYASFDTNIQLNRDNESNNLIRSKDKPQAQSNTIKEKPHILINTPPVVVTKHETDIKHISINLQRRQISSPTMIADELDELLTVLDSDENSKISNADRMKFDEGDDEKQFTLEKIIPELLKELKDSYESKDSLSTNERHLLCSSIVDYFESRKLKFSSDTMAELAEQIVEHFPKEDKKSWCNRDGHSACGRFVYRLNCLHKNMGKQTNNTSTSKAVTTSTSGKNEDEEKFKLETIIPELLKELKDSYELESSLSTSERRLLCSSIVDYFESRKIKFSPYTMDDLAEQIVEHFPKEHKKYWCHRDGYRTFGRFYFRLMYVRRNIPKQTNNTSTSKVVTNSTSSKDENSKMSNANRMKFDEEKFTLETIIPELLKELKDSYESKNSLSTNERRFLCSSIVDYFESRKLKFSSDTMDELAEQIVEQFPKEDKKSWCNRDGPDTRGRLLFRLRNARRNMGKQTSTNFTSRKNEDNEEKFTLEIIIPELLKELKDSYESKNFLSTNERRFLCHAIVDYFESRKIKFSSDTMAELAEQIVDHFPTEDKKSWCNRDGLDIRGSLPCRLRNSRKRNMAKQTNNKSISKVTLEAIIPELLKNLKDRYNSKNSLSTNQRRLLCSSIVDYFVSRKIKFNSDIMDELAEQIVEHFPTEDKKSWCNHDGPRTCGRFYFRFHNSRRNMPKQTNNTSTSKVVTNSTSSEDENSKITDAKRIKFDEETFMLETIIPGLLKELKGIYESRDSLSTNERHLLCTSIVDYFESRKIKFSLDTMDELAEQIVEHFPTEDKKSWCNRDGRSACGSFVYRLYKLRRKMAKQTSTNFEDDEEKFTLETIIPELLKEMKDSYELKNSLSTNERHLLCTSIVDYFESRKIKFSLDTMDELAEQIVEHFPTEDKKSWCNRDGRSPCGSFVYRLYKLRRNMAKQTNNTSTSKVVINSTSREPESPEEVHDEDNRSIQAWLKSHKCEHFSEIIDLWEDTMKYRCWQTQNLKDLESIREFLNNWPSYKLETGHELLTMDFRYLYPQAMETFHTLWLVYKQNIEQFLKVELKDVNCIKLLEKYQLQKATINEDSSSCILIYLVHDITKPLRHFEAVNGNVSYAITDSQNSMMRLIRHKAEIDEYTEPYPCVFVVGDSMLEVQECYVVFMDLHYKLSYENCLAVCVQIFTVLKVEDPPASQCFWEFLRGYMFNIVKDKEKFNLATENMVNYLETVASSVL